MVLKMIVMKYINAVITALLISMTHNILEMTIKVINVINVIFIIIIVLYLSIIKRKVKIQSHFSPPCGGRNSFGIFSQICFHFHFLLLLFLFQKWFHFHFLLLLFILSKQSNQRCQQTRLTLLFSFQSFSVPIIGSLSNPSQ